MSVLRLLSPRLAYRLRHGWWCDHKTYRYQSWMDEVDAQAGALVIEDGTGWGDWHMIDFGMDKIRYCQRCGHCETLTGPVLRGIRRDIAYWWRLRSRAFHNRVIEFGSIASGAAFMSMVLFAPHWLDYTVSGVATIALIPLLRRVWREHRG